MGEVDPKAKAASLCDGSVWDGWREFACERRTTNANGYCWQHQNQAPPRAAVTTPAEGGSELRAHNSPSVGPNGEQGDGQ